MASLWTELKRRNVPRVAAAYAVAAWLTVEVSSVVLPAFAAPEAILRAVIILVLLGFPIALVIAWTYQMTPQGLKRDEEVDREQDARRQRSNRLNVITLTILVLAAGMFLFERMVPWVETVDRKSIAVLPFENMSGDASNDPFTNGIHDDLLTHISRIGSIKTISRTSVLQYRGTTKTIPEIGNELGVATILEGGIQRAGDRVRINVQLIDTATDEHLWADSYDRQLTASNVFAIQTEIAVAVADALRATLSTAEQRRLEYTPTENLAAMEAYYLGKQLLEERSRESLFAAVEYFEKVIELDPRYALAHSGLADAYMLLPEYTPTVDMREAREKSEAAADRALELGPEEPEVLASAGWNRLIHYYDWADAERLLRRALQIEPNNSGALHWLSHVLSWQGQHTEALATAERALEVDPHTTLMAMNLAYIRADASLFDQAIARVLESIEEDPDYSELHGNLWLTYLRAGQPGDAANSIVEWAKATGRDVAGAREVGAAFVRYGHSGDLQPLADELLARMEFGLEDLAQVYAFVGDAEHALTALEEGYEQRSGSRSVLSMQINPGYDFVRNDPRFIALLERLGL
ncbi:MAG: tetratricopeptide repeat protein [Gammaproteobacteria bacterium]|nr:MAG: tetratricopeptide repeat protein [Gammaproteobacteria bacterium]